MTYEAGPSDLRLCLRGDEPAGPEVRLPVSAVRLLKGIPAETARGHAVALLPVEAELTTQQAAGLLQVSRPFLIGLLEAGRTPYRRLGQHRRVRLDNQPAYRRQDDEARRRIADELTADAQELGIATRVPNVGIANGRTSGEPSRDASVSERSPSPPRRSRSLTVAAPGTPTAA